MLSCQEGEVERVGNRGRGKENGGEKQGRRRGSGEGSVNQGKGEVGGRDTGDESRIVRIVERRDRGCERIEGRGETRA